MVNLVSSASTAKILQLVELAHGPESVALTPCPPPFDLCLVYVAPRSSRGSHPRTALYQRRAHSSRTEAHLSSHTPTQCHSPIPSSSLDSSPLQLRLRRCLRLQHQHHRGSKLVLCRSSPLMALEDMEGIPRSGRSGPICCQSCSIQPSRQSWTHSSS